MYDEIIEYLKKEIKEAYERYMLGRKDDKVALLDLAKFFNIPIDGNRIKDYVVDSINFDYPSIRIFDAKTKTLYISNYTNNAELLNTYGGPVKYDSVISINPEREEKRLHYIENGNPIITRMTFNDGEYGLVFERQEDHSVGIFKNAGIRMAIRYLKNNISDEISLINRIYKTKKNYDFFEQIYINPKLRQVDKYCHVENNNVIYGINDCKQKNICDRLDGICFESTESIKSANANVLNYLPFNMNAKDYSLLKKENIYSAMIFSVGIGINNYSLQIYKGSDVINVIYCEKYFHETTEEMNRKYSLPNLSNGTILSEEIKNVLSSLQERLGDSAFMGIISKELNYFSTRIDIKKGLIKEKTDPLSPKIFIDKTFDEICSIIAQNKCNYFRLIKEQFEEVLNSQEKSQEKVFTLSKK